MTTIPENFLDLLTGPIYAVLTTVSPEGQPENTVVWCSWDGEYVLVNTVIGRRKEQNARHNPHVAVTVIDPTNPYRWMDVRGVVAEFVPDTDYANIDAHAKLYQGVDHYYGGVAPANLRGVDKRVILRIRPQRVLCYPHH